MNLQSVFNQLLLGQRVELVMADKKEYDSLRIVLIKKFKKANDGMESIGDYNPYKGMYVSASWNGTTNTATFSIEPTENKRRKSYTVINL